MDSGKEDYLFSLLQKERCLRFGFMGIIGPRQSSWLIIDGTEPGKGAYFFEGS